MLSNQIVAHIFGNLKAITFRPIKFPKLSSVQRKEREREREREREKERERERERFVLTILRREDEQFQHTLVKNIGQNY